MKGPVSTPVNVRLLEKKAQGTMAFQSHLLHLRRVIVLAKEALLGPQMWLVVAEDS